MKKNILRKELIACNAYSVSIKPLPQLDEFRNWLYALKDVALSQ